MPHNIRMHLTGYSGRWAPEGNSGTQPVGAIGNGRRIMAT
jgi:hypothetical protein